jgi:hypothetical protein
VDDTHATAPEFAHQPEVAEHTFGVAFGINRRTGEHRLEQVAQIVVVGEQAGRLRRRSLAPIG